MCEASIILASRSEGRAERMRSEGLNTSCTWNMMGILCKSGECVLLVLLSDMMRVIAFQCVLSILLSVSWLIGVLCRFQQCFLLISRCSAGCLLTCR